MKKHNIKILSFIMSLIISFSVLGTEGSNIFALDDSSANQAPPYTEDTELFSWNCNNQAKFESAWAYT